MSHPELTRGMGSAVSPLACLGQTGCTLIHSSLETLAFRPENRNQWHQKQLMKKVDRNGAVHQKVVEFRQPKVERLPCMQSLDHSVGIFWEDTSNFCKCYGLDRNHDPNHQSAEAFLAVSLPEKYVLYRMLF